MNNKPQDAESFILLLYYNQIREYTYELHDRTMRNHLFVPIWTNIRRAMVNMIKQTYQNGGSNPPMKSTVTDNPLFKQ